MQSIRVLLIEMFVISSVCKTGHVIEELNITKHDQLENSIEFMKPLKTLNFEDIVVNELFAESFELRPKFANPIQLQVSDESDYLLIRCKNQLSEINSLYDIKIFRDSKTGLFGDNGFILTESRLITIFVFNRNKVQSNQLNGSETDLIVFNTFINDFKTCGKQSVFFERTDKSLASNYFEMYGHLSTQQFMLNDSIRTSTYRRAILSNIDDFKDKVVLDVGAGTGILSFFAAQAGARKIYAVEASSMAKLADTLVLNNKLNDRIQVIHGIIEEISLPEKVDIIISESMGYMLFDQRMLETFIYAKKWLIPNGKMYPSRADFHIAPFSDSKLYEEQLTKANFWGQHNFHGVDLSSLRSEGLKQYFYKPIVNAFDIKLCIAESYRYSIDFTKAEEKDFYRIDIPFSFVVDQTSEVHGLAFWFDVAFFGSQQTVWLSTSPAQPRTHWQQVRCLVDTPLSVQKGETLTGRVVLTSNEEQSYDIDIGFGVEGRPEKVTNSLDMKNIYFRYWDKPPAGSINYDPNFDRNSD